MKKKIVNYLRKAEWEGNKGPLDRLLLAVYRCYRRFRLGIRRIDDPTYSRLFLRSRNLKRNLSGSRINFVSIDQASIWTTEWIQAFPTQYDLVVGVPRSGMLVASIIALKLGKGLTTPDLLKSGDYWHSSRAGRKLSLDEIRHILVVDDSIDKGRAMAKAMTVIESIDKDFSVTKAALIVREKTKHKADLYYKVIEPPRSFEWNLMHRKIASYAGSGMLATDLDGVLCANPPRGADEDEDWYLEWLGNANPYFIPGFEIDVILTCRLEQYREPTEHWLRRNGVQFKALQMWDVPNKDARRGSFARYKSDALLRIKPDMYWESDWEQAQTIWKETRIPTLCFDEMTLLN